MGKAKGMRAGRSTAIGRNYKGSSKNKQHREKTAQLAAEAEEAAGALEAIAAGPQEPEPEQEQDSLRTSAAPRRGTAQEARRRRAIVYRF
eukprot:3194124-Prymnesium_polylepis.1